MSWSSISAPPAPPSAPLPEAGNIPERLLAMAAAAAAELAPVGRDFSFGEYFALNLSQKVKTFLLKSSKLNLRL